MVDVLDTGTWNPEQALLEAQHHQDSMRCVAIAYIEKDEEFPRLTCSSMKPIDIHLLGVALQEYALEIMRE
jgi:hypothetical protein